MFLKYLRGMQFYPASPELCTVGAVLLALGVGAHVGSRGVGAHVCSGGVGAHCAAGVYTHVYFQMKISGARLRSA